MGFEDIAPEKICYPYKFQKLSGIFSFFLFFFLQANFCVPCLLSLMEDVKYCCVDVTQFKTWTHIESLSHLMLEKKYGKKIYVYNIHIQAYWVV